MKKFLIRVFLAFALFNSLGVEAVIHNVKIYKHKNGKTLICCSAFHYDLESKPKGFQQQDDIIAGAKKWGAHLIAEDPLHYSGTNKEMLAYRVLMKERLKDYKQSSNFTSKTQNKTIQYDFVVADLVQKCLDQKLSVYNAECRHLKHESASEVVLIKGSEVAADLLKQLEEYKCALDKLKDFDDSFAQTIREYGLLLLEGFKIAYEEPLKVLKNSSKTVAQLIRDECLPGDLDFMLNQLVDLRILLNTYENRSKSHIIICVGATHIDVLAEIFPDLGYELQGEFGIKNFVSDFVSKGPLYIITKALDMKETFASQSGEQKELSEKRSIIDIKKDEETNSVMLKKKRALVNDEYDALKQKVTSKMKEIHTAQVEYLKEVANLKQLEESIAQHALIIETKGKEYIRLCALLDSTKTKNKDSIKKDASQICQDYVEAFTKKNALLGKFQVLQQTVQKLRSNKEDLVAQKNSLFSTEKKFVSSTLR